jgi:diguanylate cyclase (GGDEF)-like protein
MFDIDHFKDFNDTYGHDGGDTLLKILGDFLKQNTRSEDIACRYGGEEFVVVLPNTHLQNAIQKAESLRTGVSKMSVTHLGKALRACTISIGVATFPQNGQTAEELLKSVDNALYTAKRKGRNRVVSSKKE